MVLPPSAGIVVEPQLQLSASPLPLSSPLKQGIPK